MKLEIVVHCWRYSRVLAYQLSSLVLFPVKGVKVSVHVFYDKDDELTVNMLRYFAERHPHVFDLHRTWQPVERLKARCHGRNIAAHETDADVVWFTDADYIFREGCLDALSNIPIEDGRLYFPRRVYLQNSKRMGADAALKVTGPGLFSIDEDQYHRKKFAIPYGGLQIVSGNTARAVGYCDPNNARGHEVKCRKVQAPVYDNTFHCPGDVVFRRIMKHPDGSIPIELPNLYRIRQIVGQPGERGVHPVDTL